MGELKNYQMGELQSLPGGLGWEAGEGLRPSDSKSSSSPVDTGLCVFPLGGFELLSHGSVVAVAVTAATKSEKKAMKYN